MSHVKWMPSSLPDNFTSCELPGMVEDTELKESNLLNLTWRKKKKEKRMLSLAKKDLFLLFELDLYCWPYWSQALVLSAGFRISRISSSVSVSGLEGRWTTHTFSLQMDSASTASSPAMYPQCCSQGAVSGTVHAGLPPRPVIVCPHHPIDSALPLCILD